MACNMRRKNTFLFILQAVYREEMNNDILQGKAAF